MRYMEKPSRSLIRQLVHLALKHRQELVQPRYQKEFPHPVWGLCYVLAEAYYHLEGKRLGFKPKVCLLSLDNSGESLWSTNHWYLERPDDFECIDPVVEHLTKMHRFGIYYFKIRGCGFLTKKPSKRARDLMYWYKQHAVLD